MSERTPMEQSSELILRSLIAGAVAGTAVDISLFPLDTVKTRLQSRMGFWNAGGFSRIYAGIGPTILGSAPTAAVFFCGYEVTKHLLNSSGFANKTATNLAVHHIVAASVGEVVGCLIRVPVEVVKQRSQAFRLSSWNVFKDAIKTEGFGGLYRGFGTTIMREIPFSAIQFPLWEFTKKILSERQGGDIHIWQSALCGSLSGAVAAAITTPMDVAKTRIMLAKSNDRSNVWGVLRCIYRERGAKGLFAGIIPRMTWISLGGFVFLGVYDLIKLTMM